MSELRRFWIRDFIKSGPRRTVSFRARLVSWDNQVLLFAALRRSEALDGFFRVVMCRGTGM
jgi:hypothetical protein